MQTHREQAAFFQNRDGSNLLGIVHRPDQGHSDLGIVFCHPISWEKQFSYRAYFEFSRFLADQGYTSLRFDAYGFGESDGELEEATIQTQVNDVLDSISWLQQTAGCSRIVLAGVRLGATIAMLAAENAPNVAGLVLVSPVVDGAAYWKELLRFSRFGRMSQGQKLVSAKSVNAGLEAEGHAELDGESFGRQFVEELKAINLGKENVEFNGSCMLRELSSGGVASERFEEFAGSLRNSGANVAATFDEPQEFWLMSTRYKGYVPTQLFQQTTSWLGEVSR